jgi:ketosteroid isomerase-like protein
MSNHTIEALLTELAEHACAKNVDGIMALYHPDATSFEAGPHQERAIGVEQIRANCAAGYRGLTGEFTYQFAVERIVAGDTVGFCFGVERIAGEQGGQFFTAAVRATYAFQKYGDRWFIAHQHLEPVDVDA